MLRVIRSGLILIIMEERQLKIVPITTKGKKSGAPMNPRDIIELGMLVRRTTTRSTSTRMSNAGAVPTLSIKGQVNCLFPPPQNHPLPPTQPPNLPSPKGAPCDSPEQRSGNGKVFYQALKGRNNGCSAPSASSPKYLSLCSNVRSCKQGG